MVARLTPRQRQVLVRLAHGKTEMQVAAEMGISLQTVKNHVGEAYKTLEVTNRYGAFLELGWMTPPER